MNLTAIDQAAALPNADAVDKRLLLPSGRLKLLPAAEFDAIAPNDLAYFCWRTGRYGLVTQELITFLGHALHGRRAIEIGAGNGDLGFHAGIPMTDLKLQDQADVAAFYAATKQPTIKYPADVLKLEAVEAVKRMRPAVVVGSWITHWVDPRLDPGPAGGSVYGVQEDKILSAGASYLMIGHIDVHDRKPLRRKHHIVFNIPGQRSRSDAEGDAIYVWGALAQQLDAAFDRTKQTMDFVMPDKPRRRGDLPAPETTPVD